MTTPYEYLDIRRIGRVEYLTLNRPDVRNAFNAAVVRELATWAERTASDTTVRVAVLAGAGKVFSAGADIAWLQGSLHATEEENYKDARATADMLAGLDGLRVPLVGRVHGAALGGGCGLAAVCDVVVAAEATVFGFTETKLGILPSLIAPYALAKIGPSAARELFLTGARFDAARAHAIGLVHAVVAPDDLDRKVDEYVRELLTAAPTAIAQAKQLLARLGAFPLGRNELADLTSRTIARQRVSPEGQEGLRAFLEKRPASWVE
jgi:methylglutaconyl-CoA hydratase